MTAINKIAMAVAAATFAAAAPAQAIDINLGLDTTYTGDDPSSPNKPWVNIRLFDLSDVPGLVGGPADSFKTTVEMQITTTQTSQPDGNFLAGIGIPSCCGVPGRGNLTGSEFVSDVYLNFNPNLDLSKLSLKWTGDGSLDFPLPGVSPVNIQIAENGFSAPGDGNFDIKISFETSNSDPAQRLAPLGTSWSKLLFTYDGGSTDISPNDFYFFSQPKSPGNQLSYLAVAHVQGIDGPAGSGHIAAVPEPETYAMMAAGLGLLGFQAWRRRKA